MSFQRRPFHIHQSPQLVEFQRTKEYSDLTLMEAQVEAWSRDLGWSLKHGHELRVPDGLKLSERPSKAFYIFGGFFFLLFSDLKFLRPLNKKIAI